MKQKDGGSVFFAFFGFKLGGHSSKSGGKSDCLDFRVAAFLLLMTALIADSAAVLLLMRPLTGISAALLLRGFSQTV